MKQRSPAAVFILSLVTFGIYCLYWQVSTKNELNRLGAEIPTAWLLIVPIANLYWIWRYSEGIEKVSNGKITAVLTLILLLLLSIVGMAILQSEFNKLSFDGVTTDTPVNPGANNIQNVDNQSTGQFASAHPADTPEVTTPNQPTPPTIQPPTLVQ
ncbi:MAG: hypothetical protein NVS1B10_07290 [Candidatus Saccharimonadales bacterium]